MHFFCRLTYNITRRSWDYILHGSIGGDGGGRAELNPVVATSPPTLRKNRVGFQARQMPPMARSWIRHIQRRTQQHAVTNSAWGLARVGIAAPGLGPVEPPSIAPLIHQNQATNPRSEINLHGPRFDLSRPLLTNCFWLPDRVTE